MCRKCVCRGVGGGGGGGGSDDPSGLPFYIFPIYIFTKCHLILAHSEKLISPLLFLSARGLKGGALDPYI